MTAPATDWPEAEQRITQIARTRRGRHRDRALASWRRTRAIELRAAGLSYDQIATEVGYTNRGTAYNVVTQALAARQAHSVDQMRGLELARLEAAHAALWPRAMQGHVPSVAAVLRILDLECRLQGLYETATKPGPKDSWDHCEGPPTVVISQNDCRHLGCPAHGSFVEQMTAATSPSVRGPSSDSWPQGFDLQARCRG